MRPASDRRTRAAGTAAVYGTILVMAVVASVSEDEAADAIEIDEAVILSSGALFVAHVYAGLFARRLEPGEEGWGAQLRASLVEAWPLMGAAVVPVVILLIAALAGLSRGKSVAVALAAGLIQLFAWGIVAARAHRQHGLRAVGSGVLSVAIGFLVVLLKAVVH
jgi:hypothetical protein